jgi:hypothetical protein
VKGNRLVLLAAAGASVLVLSGCSRSVTGDIAATVDGTTITNSDVNFLAKMQCNAINAALKDPTQSGNVQAISRRQLRSDMLNALVQAHLNSELAAEQKVSYDRATYRQVMDQFESAVQAAAKKDQSRFRDLVGSLYQGQLEVYAVAARELAAQGVTQPTQQQVEGVVSALQRAFQSKADIHVDPVYGADATGLAGGADASLSKPLSAFAKASVASPEDPSWVTGLPTNQKCG